MFTNEKRLSKGSEIECDIVQHISFKDVAMQHTMECTSGLLRLLFANKGLHFSIAEPDSRALLTLSYCNYRECFYEHLNYESVILYRSDINTYSK